MLIDVLLGHRTIPAQAIVAGMKAALAVGVVDAEVILNRSPPLRRGIGPAGDPDRH